jgi:hypothetical protein
LAASDKVRPQPCIRRKAKPETLTLHPQPPRADARPDTGHGGLQMAADKDPVSKGPPGTLPHGFLVQPPPSKLISIPARGTHHDNQCQSITDRLILINIIITIIKINKY